MPLCRSVFFVDELSSDLPSTAAQRLPTQKSHGFPCPMLRSPPPPQPPARWRKPRLTFALDDFSHPAIACRRPRLNPGIPRWCPPPSS
jgi:hypothetical protein